MSDVLVNPEPGDLAGLLLDADPVPAQAAPDLTPNVIKRAAELATAAKETGPAKKPISDETKIKFLAHILQNEPFRFHSEYVDGKIVIEFATISAETEAIWKSVVAWEEDTMHEATAADRKSRYGIYLIVASLTRFDVDGVSKLPLIEGKTSMDRRDAVKHWLQVISKVQLDLLRFTYDQFDSTLRELLAEAGTANFW